MKQLMKTTALLVMLIAVVAGCDKAEKALEKTGLGGASEVTSLLGNATKTLSGITDIESAKAALPALKDIDLDLGKLMETVKDMKPEQKSKVMGIVTKALPQLEGLITKVSSLSGVGDVVGPTLESMQGKLKDLM